MNKAILHIILIFTICLHSPTFANIYTSNVQLSTTECEHMDKNCCEQKESKQQDNCSNEKRCMCCHVATSPLFILLNQANQEIAISIATTSKSIRYSTPNLSTSFTSIWNPPQ